MDRIKAIHRCTHRSLSFLPRQCRMYKRFWHGAGSSFEGQLTPTVPSVSLDVSRMNRILEISPQDFLVTVEPGATREQLNATIEPVGLFFPVDPGANATLGGMAATNASGTTTV